MIIKTSIINISSESPPPYFNVSLCATVKAFLATWGLQDGRWGQHLVYRATFGFKP